MDIMCDEGLTSCSSKLQTIADELTNCATKIEGLSSGIASFWSGVDATEACEAMQRSSLILAECSVMLKSYATFLNGVPGVYSSLENTFASRGISV